MDNTQITARRTNFLYVSLAVVLTACLSFGVYQYQAKNRLELFVTNQYARSLHDVAGYVDDVDHLLTKVRLMKLPEQSAPMFAEIWKQAGAAHENLVSLPYNHEVVVDTLKYLTQVSDFSYSMMMKNIEGERIEKEDLQKIDQIKEYSNLLAIELNNTIAISNVNGGVVWKELEKETMTQQADSNENIIPAALLGSMANIGKTFQNYPALIYDGPFSAHLQDQTPQMTMGKAGVTMEEAMKIARDVCRGETVTQIHYAGETPEGIKNAIPVYSFEVVLGDSKDPNLFIDITKHGGLPLWMLNVVEIPFNGIFITTNEAINAAEQFLDDNGYHNMKYSYYELSDYSVVINYAPFIGGVIMYPDLVKVKVSLVDGTVLGFEAAGYINQHHKRTLPEKILTTDEARSYVADELFIKSTSKAVIPLPSGKEALCYEFNGTYDDHTFLIYINAETGKMENVYELMINAFGVLAE